METSTHPAVLLEDVARYRAAQSNLCKRIREYAAASGRSEEAVCWVLFKDRRALTRLDGGSSLSPRVFETTIELLVDLELRLARKKIERVD